MDKYTFGKNLYELRNKKGLTQKELGKLLGVSDKAVSKWETGEAMPRTAKLVLITDLFGVTMEQLSSEEFDCNSDDFQQNETFEQKESRYKKYFDNAMKQHYTVSKFWSVVTTIFLVATVIVLIASLGTGGSIGVAVPLWKITLCYLLPFFILIYAKVLFRKIYKNREKTELSDFVPLTLTLIAFSVVFCITELIMGVTKEDIGNCLGCLVFCSSLSVLLHFLKLKNKAQLNEKKLTIIFVIALISLGFFIGANLANEVALFITLAMAALVLSIMDILNVALITSVLDSTTEKVDTIKKKFLRKALCFVASIFIVVLVALTFLPGLAYKIHCKDLQKGQEINAQWEAKDILFEKGESKRISMDWFSVEIPKELKREDYKTSADYLTSKRYKDDNIAIVSIEKYEDNAFADFDLFEISDEASEEKKAINELYLLNFQKQFGYIPENMYEYQRLAASLDADDMKIYDVSQCVLYTQLIATAQISSFGGSNKIYYVDTDRTYGEIMVSPPMSDEDVRLMASYTVVDKHNLDVEYRVLIIILNGDMDLLHKIINSVEIDF